MNWIQIFSWGGWNVWGRNVFCAMPSGGPMLIISNITTVCEFNEFWFTRVCGPYPQNPTPSIYFPPLLTPSYMVQNNFFVWLNGFLVNLDFIMKQSWSPELATVAQRWANTCREGHNPRRSSSSYRNLGENIYRRTGNALSCSKTYW